VSTIFPDPLPGEVNAAAERLTIPFSEIPAIPATYLWPGVIPNRTPVFFVAPGGTGKGLAIAAIAASVTTGAPFPGQAQGREPGQVIMVAPEDDANEDMSFRLSAAGANLDLVLDLTLLPDGAPFLLPENIPELHRAITEANAKGPPVMLVTLDPLDALAENGLSTQRHARAIINPLQDLCRDYGGAMILSHHTTKNSNVVAGSKVLTDSARMVWMIGTAKDDANVRVMTEWKSNRPTAGTMRYQIIGEGNDVHAMFTGADTGPESQAPSSRAARLRLTPAVSPEVKAQQWLAAHPANGKAEPSVEELAPEVAQTVSPPVPAPVGKEDPVAYLKRYISEGDSTQVRTIAAALLKMNEES
jgi:AAA domain-containing protein